MEPWPTETDPEFIERASEYLQLHGYSAGEATTVVRREIRRIA